MTREVDATAVCRELEGLCLSLEAHNRGLLADGTRQAIRHARCLYSMLGNPLERDRIVPKSGHSLTATYLSELVADLPWQFEFETDQRPEGDVSEGGVKVLRRWLELIRASEAGKLDKTQPGQPGHSKKISVVPDDVTEVVRRMGLKKWQGKNPIDVCRDYTREKNPNAEPDTIKREADSLKRKLNRYKK